MGGKEWGRERGRKEGEGVWVMGRERGGGKLGEGRGIWRRGRKEKESGVGE